MNAPRYLTVRQDSILLALKVQPRASANGFQEPVGSELRVRLTAPPVDDAANEALIRFLADEFHCARSQLDIVRGRNSRHKLVRIRGIPLETLLQRLPS